MIVVEGIKFGVLLAFLIGPVFFAIIQTSAERGFAKGVLVAIGVSASDAAYVLICYLGLIQLIESPVFRQQMAYIGGAILIVFGLYHLIIKSRKSIANPTVQPAEASNSFRYVLKGFFINAFSPMVPIFWISTISMASNVLGLVKDSDFTIFFSSMLATVLATDIAKAYLAGRLRSIMKPKIMMWLNLVVGAALIGFGLQLIFRSL